ncbi:MAG: HNH endonuclease [Desulfobacterales bacterium]
MPVDWSNYPADWPEIALGVKNAAGWVCAFCWKQCRRPGEKFDTHRNTLTVAHLNHQPMDVRWWNLWPLCAPCHCRYDATEKARKRREKN